MAELAEQFELHPNQIIQFRQHAVENMAGLFAKEGAAKPKIGFRPRVDKLSVKKEIIAIDCTHLVKGKCGGFESYLFGLLDGLGQIKDTSICIFVLSSQKPYFLCYESAFKIYEVNITNSVSRIIWQNLILPLLFLRYSKILFPANFRPLFIFRPSVTVIHDLQYRYHPKYWGKLRLFYRRLFIPFAVIASSKIIAISDTVKQEIIEMSPRAKNKIEVIYNPVKLSSSILVRDKRFYKNIKNYFLVPSSLAPHKNITELLEAIQILSKEPNLPTFIFTGHFSLEEFLEKYTLNSKMRVMGYVEESLLGLLYKECKAVVLPSVYEGFGIPYLEALKFKRAVIASDIPITRELLGDEPFYIRPPFSRQEISNAILSFLDHDNTEKIEVSMPQDILSQVEPDFVARKYLNNLRSC